MKKIDEQFIRREIKQQRGLQDTAIKLSDRKKARLRADYLQELLKGAADAVG